MSSYKIRITEASGDVVEEVPLHDTVRSDAERAQGMHWNAKYAHTDRYKSELLEDEKPILTIVGWDEEEEEEEEE